MRIRKKIVKGIEYNYMEETIRLETPKVYSIFLGRKIPSKTELEHAEQMLFNKIYTDLLDGTQPVHLTKEQLVEAEKHRRRYFQKIKKLSKARQDEKDEVDIVNFVYTTLTTEGVPITKEDANLAYNFTQKNIKNIRDENLQVALDMIKGLRHVKESKKGIDQKFILELHKIIMAGYKERKPGIFRKKQAYIYLKSYQKVEEIGFRPSAPDDIKTKIDEIVNWYNSNIGKLSAIELAALLHLKFYRVHPFEDGNKRVSRLLINKALFDAGYPMLNISKDTKGYFDALIYSVEKNDEQQFVMFVFEQFIKFI
ncbi:MAG: Fic family protein [Candidatus Micrarchaeota archaeon]